MASQKGQGAAPENRAVKASRHLRGIPERLLARLRSSQFNRNMGAGSAMAVITTGLSFISYPVYLHYLGYHRYGLWLLLSVIISIAQLGHLGIPGALMTLVAEDHGAGDWEGVRTYVNMGCGIILAAGLVFLGVVIAIRSFIIHWLKLGASDAAIVYSLLPYVAALSVLVLLFTAFNAALGGLGRMDLTSYNETSVQALVIVISAVLLYFGLDLRGMAIGALAAYAGGQIFCFIQVQTIMPIRLAARTRLSSHKARQLLGTGGWILSAGVCNGMLLPFTRLMLSRYAGLEAVAINDICLTGSLRVRNIFDSAFRPMTPEVSDLQVRGVSNLHDRIRSIDGKAFWLIIVVALPGFASLMIVMTPFLHMWLHGGFKLLLPDTFRIALVGAFISLLGSSSYYMLIGLGKARDVAVAGALQFAANAAILAGLAIWIGHITVGQAAVAFGVATTSATVYFRWRLFLLGRSNNAPLSRPVLSKNEAPS